MGKKTPKCGKSTRNGKGPPCKKDAGFGTDHPGEGLCYQHDPDYEGRRGGERRAYPQEVLDRVVELVAEGNYVTDACAASGMSEASFYEYQRKGDADLDNGETETKYAKFTLGVARARAENRSLMVGSIRKAAVGYDVTKTVTISDKEGNETTRIETWREVDWRAAAHYLERTDPERWAKRELVTEDERDLRRIPLEALRAMQDEEEKRRPGDKRALRAV